MNSKKAFLIGGLIFVTTTGALASIPYQQLRNPQVHCSSSPASLCDYQGAGMEVIEEDSYERTDNVFIIKMEYAVGKGFETTERIPLMGPTSWTKKTCYTIDPSTLGPISKACGTNDSTVTVQRSGVYDIGAIIITEKGELILQKNANSKFPEGGWLRYTRTVTYGPK